MESDTGGQTVAVLILRREHIVPVHEHLGEIEEVVRGYHAVLHRYHIHHGLPFRVRYECNLAWIGYGAR